MATTNYQAHYHATDYDRASQARIIGRASETRATNIVAWTLQVLLALAFLAAGLLKLASAPMAVQLFESIGFGQWFRYVTGTVEFVSAVLLFTPRTAAVGAFLLACTMVGALLTHAFIIGGNALPAAALLILSVVLVALRWNRARATIRQENVVNV